MILKMRFHKVQAKISSKAIWCFANVWPRMSGNRDFLSNPGILAFEKIKAPYLDSSIQKANPI